MKYCAFFTFVILNVVSIYSLPAFAHCQVPCGIYGDERVFNEVQEHIDTIAKAMREIKKLKPRNIDDAHTLARWTTTKEEHATKIQTIASQYFLTQRVRKPESDDEGAVENYQKSLEYIHQISVLAMKVKQTLDLDLVKDLRDATARYKKHYFAKKDH